MKRIISILLAVSFLITTTGFNVVTHYCMGRLVKSTVLVFDNYHPCVCKGACADECCKNDVSFIKIKDNFQSSVQQTVEFIPALIRILISSPLFIPAPEKYLKIISNHSPPWLIDDISVFLCTFRI